MAKPSRAAGHGLNHAGHAQDGLAGFADVADQDAQGHADEDSHAYGDGGELMFQSREKICALLLQSS